MGDAGGEMGEGKGQVGEGRGRWQRTSVLTPKICLLKDRTDMARSIRLSVLRGFAHSSEALTERQECSLLTYCLWAQQLLSAERGIYTETPAARSLL